MLTAELELPTFDYTDSSLREESYRAAMAAIESHDGWLAAGPYGFIVLDREAGPGRDTGSAGVPG